VFLTDELVLTREGGALAEYLARPCSHRDHTRIAARRFNTQLVTHRDCFGDAGLGIVGGQRTTAKRSESHWQKKWRDDQA